MHSYIHSVEEKRSEAERLEKQSIRSMLKAVACFYGGTPYGGQTECIWNGINILVGTLGLIKDHLQNGKLDPTQLKHVVLDEVDQMLDMGFADQV